MSVNLASTIGASICALVSVFNTKILRQSLPASEIEYATSEMSLEKLTDPKEVVPSSLKVFGSRNTSISPPSLER